MNPKQRVVIFGNCGAGKSALAKKLAFERGLAHLDVDTLAFDESGNRLPVEDTRKAITDFLSQHQGWVVEGCLADLLGEALDRSDECIFMDPGVEVCKDNCKDAPTEVLRYTGTSLTLEDLTGLLEFVAAYEKRSDDFSHSAHKALFDAYEGEKLHMTRLLPNT